MKEDDYVSLRYNSDYTSIPSDYRDVNSGNSSLFSTSVVKDTVEDEDIPPPSFYDINNVENDIPIKGDLNSVDVVKHLMEYTLTLREKALEVTDDNPQFDGNGEEPIMSDCGCFMSGDGSPVYTSCRIRDEDVDSYKYVQNFLGGFHMLLQIHKCRGKTYGPTHLKSFIHAYGRTSEGK